MSGLPTGTVTFLFSDVEGSTRKLRELGTDAYGALQDEHAALTRAALARRGGVEVRTEGDSFFAVFPSATDAIAVAVDVQRALAADPETTPSPIRVRVGLHTGEGRTGGDDYLGLDVNKAARVAASANGGQVVLSSTTAALVADRLPDGVAIRDLGPHALKDFDEPERLYDLVIDGLDASFPPLRTTRSRRSVLPSPRTSFVGRDEDVVEIAARLASNRLLTLTGPGGTGKTRLAVEAASAIQHRFPGGVFFVDLAGVTAREPMVGEIATVLRVGQAAGLDRVTAIAQHVGDARTLLILDNMEQLVEHAPVVSALLDSAPSLSVLVTSRIPLHLSGEVEYPVPPLPLPPAGADDASDLTRSGSIRLFLDRARAARPGFDLDGANARDVVEIVSGLDALPLAIELAASRLRMLDVATLAERLQHRLPVLTGGPRDAPERHRTLEASIRWSEGLLDADTRRLFARLAVFFGGWTLEAAETVCGGDLDVLDHLGRLVETSLVRRSGDDEPELRFSMLETIREYARDRFAALDPEEQRETERRHAAYLRALAERAEPHLTGERQLEWLDRLEREHDNVRAVLERAQRSGERDAVRYAMAIGASIWRFWQQRGYLTEARDRMSALVALPAAADRDATRARAVGAAGSLHYWLAEYEAMQRCYVEAVDIAREVGDRRLLSRALFDLTYVWLATGDIDDAVRYLNECLDVAEEDDLAVRAKAWNALGYTRIMVDDLEGALEPIERATELHRAAGERMALCESLVSGANVLWTLGRHDAAVRRLAEATKLVSATPERMLAVQIVLAHAALAIHQGRPRRAAILVGAGDRVIADHDVHFPEVGLSFFGDPGGHAREELGDAAYEEAWTIGERMDVEEMLAFIRNDEDGSPTSPGGR